MSSTNARSFLFCALASLALLLSPSSSQARTLHHYRHHHRHYRHVVAAYHPPQSAIVVDAATGRVLYAQAPDAPRYPASLTKLMTLYLTFNALDSGRLKLDQEIPVSAHAAAQEPSKIGFVPGSEITVRQAILSIVTKSANDAAVVLGEALGGTEDHFATLMTAEAKKLGMRNTRYENASGLPNPLQHTTARDMATLAMAILHHHRNYYHFFSVRSFDFEGRTIYGHDHLLGSFEGADGLKTGYIHASGFNLVTSAKRGDTRLIGVVFGGVTYRSRDAEMRHLLTVAFNDIDRGQEARIASDLGGTAPASASHPAEESHPLVQEAAVQIRRPLHRPEEARHVALRRHRTAARASHRAELLASTHKPHGERWVIQVGAFNRASLATAQAERAIKAAPGVLHNRRVGIEVPKNPNDNLYRARLAGLSESEAHNACRILERKQVGCFVVLQ